jgi:hypothetical protein
VIFSQTKKTAFAERFTFLVYQKIFPFTQLSFQIALPAPWLTIQLSSKESEDRQVRRRRMQDSGLKCPLPTHKDARIIWWDKGLK